MSPAQRQIVAEYVSGETPSPEHSLDIEFGNRLRLLGYSLDQDHWKPGEPLALTWFWAVDQAPGDGWALVTELEDQAGELHRPPDTKGRLRELYGPSHWKPGQFIVDVQELELPADWNGEFVNVRLQVSGRSATMPVTKGQEQSGGRALAARIPVARQAADGDAPPSLGVVRTKQAPRLDAELDDPVWGFAKSTAAFVEPRSGDKASTNARAKMLWDDRHLYVAVEVADPKLHASHIEHDQRLWEQDCVELMFDPNGDGKHYFEIQVSPRGVVFDTRYDSRREPKPTGHLGWSSDIRAAVRVEGQLDDELADHGYRLELAIPWYAFVTEDGRAGRPPRAGSSWRANLYVLDRRSEGQHAAAWSAPQVSDFHTPERFGSLRFLEAPSAMKARNEPVTISPQRAQQLPKNGLTAHRKLDRAALRQFRGLPGTSPVEPKRTKLESDEPPH